jgi:hypothetical protein
MQVHPFQRRPLRVAVAEPMRGPSYASLARRAWGTVKTNCRRPTLGTTWSRRFNVVATILLPMQQGQNDRPSDSLVSFGEQLRSPLATRLPRRGQLFFALRPRASADELRVGDSRPAPRVAGFFRGETRASQVPGPSSSRVPVLVTCGTNMEKIPAMSWSVRNFWVCPT